jgi:endonuclease YncB( thermonuclease family)
VVVLIVCAIAWYFQNAPDLVSEQGEYEVFAGCSLVENRSNDGDSFLVRFPDGSEKMVRLYFVDAPESAVRRYRNGDTNEKRLDYQARDLGGLTRDETIGIGQEAKGWVKKKLSAGSFTVSTKWQEVFDSGRYYGLVTVERGAGARFLHELLVEEGLARIYTEGAGLPDGTSRMAQEKKLRALEREAKAAGRGAWAY